MMHLPFTLSRFNYVPNVQIPPKKFEPALVDGMNRYKYFRRPIIPFLPQMPPNVVLAPAR
jgi:ABC-type glycerol-3-phosphate transport system permease component